MNTIKIITPGMLATVQDDGRIGHQGEGFLNSGVMDIFSIRLVTHLWVINRQINLLVLSLA